MDGEVLIISSNSVIRRNLKKILEVEGLSCTLSSPREPGKFSDPFQVQPVVGENQNIDPPYGAPRYDLGIFDMWRPERLFRKYLTWAGKKYSDLPIIVLVDEGNKIRPQPEPSAPIELAKPFKSRQILELIHYFLSKGQQSD